MNRHDDELLDEYLADCREHLNTIEAELLAIELGGPNFDGLRLRQVMRAFHSIWGGAVLLHLAPISEMAFKAEEIVQYARTGHVVFSPAQVRVLLGAMHRLKELVQDAGHIALDELDETMTALRELRIELSLEERAPAREAAESVARTLRILLVEDDFACRLLLQTFLARYGECHVAASGVEAVAAFRLAQERQMRYDLVCMDIRLPMMDGREAMRQIRKLEETQGILSSSGARFIMITTVDEVKEIMACYRELCDAYLVKPIDLSELRRQMQMCGLIQ